MSNDNVVSLAAPGEVSDPLTDLLRAGARQLIEAAVSAEFGSIYRRSRKRSCQTVGAGWCATVIFRNGRF